MSNRMYSSPFFKGIFWIALVILGFSVLGLNSQPTMTKPLYVGGWVSVDTVVGTKDVWLAVGFSLIGPSGPVTDALVKLNGQFDVPHNGRGNYYLTNVTLGHDLYLNMPMDIVIKPPLSLFPQKEQMTAKSQISALVEFLSPLNETIHLTGDNVHVRWRFIAGGARIEKIDLWNSTSGMHFVTTYRDVTGTTLDINRGYLSPNQTYSIIMWVPLNDFVFSGTVPAASDSRLRLYLKVRTLFYAR